MTSAEAACRLDVTPKHICEVIRGRARITVAFAIRLEYVFGRVAWDWLDLQWRHDLAKARDALRAEGV